MRKIKIIQVYTKDFNLDEKVQEWFEKCNKSNNRNIEIVKTKLTSNDGITTISIIYKT